MAPERWRRPIAACVLAVGISGPGPVRAEDASGHVTVQVELVEQAVCMVAPGAWRVSFVLRTTHHNAGPTLVRLAVDTARLVRAVFVPDVTAAREGGERVAFGIPDRYLPAAVSEGERLVDVAPGRTATGQVMAWVPLQAGAGTLVPGRYTARFEVRMLGLAAGAADVRPGVAPVGFAPLRLSAPPLVVAIDPPGPEQECGSFSLPLPGEPM